MVTLHLVLRAAFLSRLALALLAVLGFSAPVVERQVDEVVQTATRRPGHAQPAPLLSLPPRALVVEARPEAPVFVERPSTARRRYLEHRAWVI